MLKKYGLLLACLITFAGISHAGIFDADTPQVRYRLSVAADTSTNTVVVDLSNTTNWKHKETGEINFDVLRLSLDKLALSTCTVKLGVVNFINTSTGSVTWFFSKEVGMSTSTASSENRDFNDYRPDSIRLRVDPASTPDTDGSTPYILSNDTTSGSTTYQTDINLPSPVGNTAPGAGDLVMLVTNGTGALVVNFELLYHTRRR